MSILVTGSSGFLGTYFINKLDKIGTKYLGIDLKKNSYINIKNFKKIDIRNSNDLNLIFRKYKFKKVIHFAAIPGFDDCQKNSKLAFDTNVIGTNNLVEVSKKFKVNNFIFISSFSTKNYFSKISTYGMTKFTGEQIIINNKKNYSFNGCVVRLSNIFGKYSLHKKSVVHQFLKNFIKKKVFLIHDTGKQKRDLIYAGDVIEKLFSLSNKKKFSKDFYEISKKNMISINKLKILIDKITSTNNLSQKIRAPKGYDTEILITKSKEDKKYFNYLNKRLLKVLNWYREQRY
jgi:nucleoside-diphosphate-sugar epimerase